MAVLFFGKGGGVGVGRLQNPYKDADIVVQQSF